MEIEKNELLRYLGWKGQEVDEALQTKLDDAAKRCLAIAEPRSVVMRFPLHGGCMLGDTGIALAGDDIKRHVAGCSEVYLLAATIGAAAERELWRLSAKSTAEALLFDTAASCAVESYADDICEDLEKSCGRRLTARFSCGYGDFPLEAQKDLCKILKTDTRIGLCCDENFLLTPRKSITALVGITDTPAPEKRTEGHGCSHKCGGCYHKTCAFRRED